MDCEFADLGQLDSDDLIERGTSTLTVNGHVYLPGRFRRFDTAAANRNWYMLCGVVSAAMLLGGLFPAYPRASAIPHVCGPGRAGGLASQPVPDLEFTRVLRRACQRWPGVRRLVAWGLQVGFHGEAGCDGPERLLADALDDDVEHGRPCVRPRMTA